MKNEVEMNYIYCGSHKPLLFALWLKDTGKKITIITYNKDVIRFCNSEGINCIELKGCRITPSSSFKVFSVKKMLDAVIEKIDFDKDDSFFLLGYTKAYDCFYLAKEFSKRGIIYYKNIAGLQLKKYKPSKFKPIFFRGGIARILLRYVLGLDLIYYEVDENPVLGLADTFFQKYKITNYKPEISADELILDFIKKRKSHYKKYDNLIVDDGVLVNTIYPDSLEHISKILLEFPIKYAFKGHPACNISLFYQNFKHCPQIPSYIPAELICKNIKKNIISVYSASLITASQLNRAKVVSLLELVEWKSPSWKNEVKKWLIKESKNKILFPNSVGELQTIFKLE